MDDILRELRQIHEKLIVHDKRIKNIEKKVISKSSKTQKLDPLVKQVLAENSYDRDSPHIYISGDILKEKIDTAGSRKRRKGIKTRTHKRH